MKTIKYFTALLSVALLLTGCGENAEKPMDMMENEMMDMTGTNDDFSGEITVISREGGSGTRGAFTEIFKIVEKTDDGKKVDMTSPEAMVSNKTDVVITNVAGDKQAIGYISVGSLSDRVKALKIDGTEPKAENVKKGSYKASRPFNIVTKNDMSDLAADFMGFILSKEGQEIAGKNYTPAADDAADFSGSKPNGKITVGGSSSVAPVMEKLKEAYLKLNPDAEIEVQLSDSSAGITGVQDGTYDIGMSSRDLSDEESQSLKSTLIAKDGIAVIVNKENPIDDISSDNIKKIYTGEITDWSDVK